MTETADGDATNKALELLANPPSNLSTAHLQSHYEALVQLAQEHSQTLTQKLATSQSGQDLLHIGTSLSTLPPDLHSLLMELHPLLQATESAEEEFLETLKTLCDETLEIRHGLERSRLACLAAELIQDVVAAEAVIQRDSEITSNGAYDIYLHFIVMREVSFKQYFTNFVCFADDIDHFMALERTAHVAVCLRHQLQEATQMTALPPSNDIPSVRAPLPVDPEYATFTVTLASRIRNLESDVVVCLSRRWQALLKEEVFNLQLMGHCLRGLLLVGKEPLIHEIVRQSLTISISLGRLDEGGGRGECAGLKSCLHEICSSIRESHGGLIEYASNLHVDLVTSCVWVPLCTALLEDAALQMAVFSAGIASIIHANYRVLHEFLDSLASRFLEGDAAEKAQRAIFAHPKTREFSKKWSFNLNIYYQLRFGQACQELNAALDATRIHGWSVELENKPSETHELGLFIELNDSLYGLWKSDVILTPLTNRFLRGAVQLLGRVVKFCQDGMQGQIMFGEEEKPPEPTPEGTNNSNNSMPPPPTKLYNWGESERDVAAVAWELTILESTMRHDYVKVITNAIAGDDEVKSIVSEALHEATEPMNDIIDKAWHEVIVNLLTDKCCTPLSAVKGVAATYRMTNRPPPKQASPFVANILRPLLTFAAEFKTRTPVGNRWKHLVVVTVADRYAAAVAELIDTVQRTEATLQGRGARRKTAGGRMSDGEKVHLQLYLDYQVFVADVTKVGVEPDTVIGVSKLQELTTQGKALLGRN